MDLIYTDASRFDTGVLKGYNFDLAYGKDENDFECVIAANDHCCEADSYLYIENTEYGGIVDDISVDTAAETVSYNGRTWHGILNSKIIVPLKASETSTADVTLKLTDAQGGSLVGVYLIISGDANKCLEGLITRLGLDSLFAVSGVAGVNIAQYQFDRYCEGYFGILKMLKSAGLKLQMAFDAVTRKTILNAVPIVNYSTDEDISSDLFDYKASRKYNSVNHLICLGQGELADRIVVHLYADENGNISSTQSQFGAAEYVTTYENTSDDSKKTLREDGKERLKELWAQDAMELTVNENELEYDINDVIKTTDHITGLTATADITKKIVKITDDALSIEYEAGD